MVQEEKRAELRWKSNFPKSASRGQEAPEVGSGGSAFCLNGRRLDAAHTHTGSSSRSSNSSI